MIASPLAVASSRGVGRDLTPLTPTYLGIYDYNRATWALAHLKSQYTKLTTSLDR